MKEKSFTSTSVKFKVLGNEYNVSFPNIEQLIQIELKKNELSEGKYLSLIKTNTVGTVAVLDFIDMIAHVTVLIPSLISDLKISEKDLTKMSIIDGKVLLRAYREQLMVWINSWIKELREFETDTEISKFEEIED